MLDFTNGIFSFVSFIAYFPHTRGQCRFYQQNAFRKSTFCFITRLILFQLANSGPLTMGEIARRINRDKSTTTVLIRKLCDEGLVTSESGTKDSRTKYISLTEKGREYNSFTSSISRELLSVCYKNFSEEEKQTLLSLLLKMSENVDSAKKERLTLV